MDDDSYRGNLYERRQRPSSGYFLDIKSDYSIYEEIEKWKEEREKWDKAKGKKRRKKRS